MFTDRDFYRCVLAGALESFELEKLAGLLNVPAPGRRPRPSSA